MIVKTCIGKNENVWIKGITDLEMTHEKENQRQIIPQTVLKMKSIRSINIEIEKEKHQTDTHQGQRMESVSVLL